jgi:anti-sigma factor RsiW
MNGKDDKQLDRLGAIVTRTGGISDDELQKIDSSPFLRTRLRTAIESERRRSEQQIGWLARIGVATRAIAMMAIVTIAAVVSFWFSRPASNAPGSSQSRQNDVARVVIGGTCALSTDGCSISNEAVLATLFKAEGEEAR